MKSLTKKVLIIILSILIMGLIAAIPGFAETQEELKQIFVTRDEINAWIYGSSDAVSSVTGISEVLANLEVKMQESVQSKVKYEMSIREIKDNAESSTTASP